MTQPYDYVQLNYSIRRRKRRQKLSSMTCHAGMVYWEQREKALHRALTDDELKNDIGWVNSKGQYVPARKGKNWHVHGPEDKKEK